MTVPVTVPSVPPFTVTVLTPLVLVTVTVTVVPDDEVVPRISEEVVVNVEVPPSGTVWPLVVASNAQGLMVMLVGATRPGMVDSVTLKIHEP